MSTSATNNTFEEHESEEVAQSEIKGKKAIIIGKEEFIKINILNKLNNTFDYNVMTKETTDEGLDYITQEKPGLVIIDLDNFNHDAVERVFTIIKFQQTACLFMSSDSSVLNKIKSENDFAFMSFLPKSIVNSMFNETVSLLIKKSTTTKKLENRIHKASVSSKPVSFYLLALLLFTEPLIKALYLKFSTGFTWEVLARTIFSIEGALANFEFWALFPIAGIALISVRSWSFLVFIGVQLYSLYSHLFYEEFSWPYVAETPHVSSLLLLILNASIICYFMTPKNFQTYWSKTSSIWRNTSRFATKIPTNFADNDTELNTIITNISESGAYFTSPQNLPIGRSIALQFNIDGKIRSINAIIRRAQNTAHDEFFGYGVEFKFNNSEEKDHIRRYVETLGTRIQ
jgi:hypothetical protein